MFIAKNRFAYSLFTDNESRCLRKYPATRSAGIDHAGLLRTAAE